MSFSSGLFFWILLLYFPIMAAEEKCYHAIVLSVDDYEATFGAGVLFRTRSEIRVNIVGPYFLGNQFMMGGKKIDPDKVATITILQSEPEGKTAVTPSRETYSHHDRYKWSESRDFWVTVWKDVTDDFMTFDESVSLAEPIVHSIQSEKKNKVFIVHGRDSIAHGAMVAFLREIGLQIVGWKDAKSLTKSGAPYNLQAVEKGIDSADAVVVLSTPDDEARTKAEYVENTVESGEQSVLIGQPRANVIFEAGMSLARKRSSTVVVEFGSSRSFSDMDGVQTVRLNNARETEARQNLIESLRDSGLEIDERGRDWVNAGDFQLARYDLLPSQDNSSGQQSSSSIEDAFQLEEIISIEAELKGLRNRQATSLIRPSGGTMHDRYLQIINGLKISEADRYKLILSHGSSSSEYNENLRRVRVVKRILGIVPDNSNLGN